MFAVIISSYNASPSTVHPVTTWFIISLTNISCSSQTGSSNHNNSISHIDQNVSEQLFVDDSTVQFCPGDHHLTSSLRLDNVQNLILQGSPDSNINIHPWVNITLENCINITISSLTFNFTGDYSYFLIFTHTSFTQLSNVSFYGRISTMTGCSAVMSTNSIITVTDSNFTGLHGWLGAAMLTTGSNVTLIGNAFKNNTANSGGAIYLYRSHLYLKSINTFTNNIVIPLGNNYNGILCELKEIEHINGSGGAMFSHNSTLKSEGDLRFTGNCALDRGSGGAIAAKNSEITMYNLTCNSNRANDGGAISTLSTNLQIFGVASLENNTARFGGALHLSKSELLFSSILFQNSTIRGNTAIEQGGAIRSFDTMINFASNIVFKGNQADTGGAIKTVRQSTTLSVILNSKLYFIENHANRTGGAIHVNDPPTCLNLFINSCFFIANVYIGKAALVFFIKNSANTAGNALFGGQLDRCEYSPTVGRLNSERDSDIEFQNLSSSAMDLFKNISIIIPQTPLDISSKPEKIKICNYSCDIICNTFMTNESLDSCTEHHRIPVYPGANFMVTIMPLGQANNAAPTNIVYKSNNDYNLVVSNTTRSNVCLCHDIFYRLNVITHEVKTNQTVEYKLYHNNDSCNSGINLTLNVLKCPTGFALSKVQAGQSVMACMCSEQLQKFSTNCYIDDLTIERTRNNFWVSQLGNTSGLILHKSGCPFDFCKNYSIKVTLKDPSVQCDFNRVGILCGACKDGYSLTLGNLHCNICSNSNISLVIFFALAGMALVAIIFLLRLTVAVGTCNGLIFYANIIQANYYPFFPRATINFFTIFISWLNLDFGIEACFYNGMNIYVYSWLQFLFPLYVWFLIGAIILVSHYSRRASRCFGQNPVAVLATLFLVSYSKILSAIIVPLSSTVLTYTYPTEKQHSVWLYDGNVHFFHDHKHVALALFAILLLICAFLPYTLLLLSGYWLQAYAHRPIFSQLNKIKPFMDAYYAPYRKNTRYWTGLLLLARGGLFLTFASNTIGSGSVNLLAISLVATALAIMKGRVYEKHYNDILESSFILNLCIFSVATFYVREERSGSQYILSSISVGAAFITFIGIITFHAYVQLKGTATWKTLIILFAGKFQLLCERVGIVPTRDEHNHDDGDGIQSVTTYSTVELREPLLESNID